MSLRRYLLTALLGGLAVLLLTSAIVGYLESRHELEEVFDAELAQHAKVLRASLAPAINRQAGLLAIESWQSENAPDHLSQDDEEAWERTSLGHAYENKIAFQLWSVDGTLRARSDSAPLIAFSDFVAGYSEKQHEGHAWRVFTLRTADGGWIQVGHRDDVRGELSAEIALQSIWPALVLIPVMALTIVLVLRRALQPLKSLVRSVGERTPEQLEPLPVSMAPDEVQPLLRSFNALMARLSSAFQQQKRFIADAAHELKTPLAALQIHTENALATEGDERKQALLHVKEGIVRTNRLVEQLLLLSRLEHAKHPDQGGASSTQSLTATTAQLLEELSVLSHSRQLQLTFDSDGNDSVRGSEMALRALLRNLLDNALRYSPDHGQVTVQIFRDESGLCWRVCDQGPGITPTQHEQVFEPFYRELGKQATGSGLGLAIAREAAEQLGARIELADNQPTGLCVSVRWP